MKFITVAIARLEAAGYKVTYAPGGIPMLFDVEGLARDVTAGQLCDLADQHGEAWMPLQQPQIRIDYTS